MLREQTSHPPVTPRPIAVVTGATGGIGSAIALALAGQGMQVCVLGRNKDRLSCVANRISQFSDASSYAVDLTVESELQSLFHYLNDQFGRVDILVHAAGVMRQDRMESAKVEEFDLQYMVNVRAPYALTKHLLPLLIAARGQIVFINSTVGLSAKRQEIGQYAATKQALKGIADSLREELNPQGIRVLSVFVGRIATPMQEEVCRRENKVYRPETLIQPEDIASVVVNTILLPPTVEVIDVALRPMKNPNAA